MVKLVNVQKIIRTFHEALQIFFRGKIIDYFLLTFLFLFIIFVHIGIFSYSFKHIHLLESPEAFSALGKDETSKQLRAILLILGLIIFWIYLLWLGFKSLFSNNDKAFDLKQAPIKIDVNKISGDMPTIKSNSLANTGSISDSGSKVEEFEQAKGYEAKPLSEK